MDDLLKIYLVSLEIDLYLRSPNDKIAWSTLTNMRCLLPFTEKKCSKKSTTTTIIFYSKNLRTKSRKSANF